MSEVQQMITLIVALTGIIITFYFTRISRLHALQIRFETFYNRLSRASGDEIRKALSLPDEIYDPKAYIYVVWRLQLAESVYHDTKWRLMDRNHSAYFYKAMKEKYFNNFNAKMALKLEGFDPKFAEILGYKDD